MDPARRERLRHLREIGYFASIERLAKSVCAPLLFRTRRGILRNGSMTLVAPGTGFLGLTAGHVAAGIRRHCAGDRPCQLGAVALSPDALIDQRRDPDLATFRVDVGVLAASRHLAFPVASWPAPAATTKDILLFGGYPGSLRREGNDQYDVAFVWFAGRAQSVSQRHMGLVLNIKQSICVGADRVRSNANLGGCSGGPVFRIVDEAAKGGQIVRFELVGIVYEYSSRLQLLFAHHLGAIQSDGRIMGRGGAA